MTSSTPELTLYGYFRSSASARVRTVLEIHKIQRTNKYIHLLKGEQKSEEYAALNPAKTLPLLVIKDASGEWSISQCIAIMEWLDEEYGSREGNTPLLPRDDARARATVRSIVDLIIGDLFPMLTMGTLGKIKARGCDATEWATECSTQYLTGECSLTSIVLTPALEEILSRTSTSKKYAYGDSLTLADVALSTQMYTVIRFTPDILKQFPTVRSIFEHISKLPPFVAADYMHQPDTPEDQRA